MFEIEHHLIEYKGGTIIVRFELIDRKHVKINIHTSTSNIAYVVLINEVFQYIKFNPHNVMAYDTNRKQLIFPTSYIATKIYKENQELFKSNNTYSISLNMYLFYLSQDKRDNTNDIIYANDKMKDIITNSKGYLYIENKIFYEYNKPIKHDDILILTDKDDTNFKVLDNIGDEEIKIYNIYNNIKDVKKAYAKIHNVKNIYIAQMCKRYRDNQ